MDEFCRRVSEHAAEEVVLLRELQTILKEIGLDAWVHVLDRLIAHQMEISLSYYEVTPPLGIDLVDHLTTSR